MRLIPVLDLKAGQAVHAVAGDRDHYGPLRSVLHPSSDPLALARAIHSRTGLAELYLADLDAIAGGPPAFDLYRALGRPGTTLWLDAGVRDAADARALLDAGVGVVVLGLETLNGPGVLRDLASVAGQMPHRLAFSLDLRAGRPLVDAIAAWGTNEPVEIAAQAVGLGMRRLIVLDLARVGMNQGPGAEAILAALHAAHPDVELIAGGGARSWDDLESLARIGASAVLVGSALHDGRIRADGHDDRRRQ